VATGGVANVTAPYARLGHDLFYGLKKEVSMSLKFAAVGSLTVLSPFRLPARACDRARKVVLGESYDPLLAMLGGAIKVKQPKTSEAEKRAAERARS
jgi:hypothetical protein